MLQACLNLRRCLSLYPLAHQYQSWQNSPQEDTETHRVRMFRHSNCRILSLLLLETEMPRSSRALRISWTGYIANSAGGDSWEVCSVGSLSKIGRAHV